MLLGRNTKWFEEAEVVVVGYGGAGAVAAIAAHDAGAKVLILEKQPADTPTQTRHTPNTRMAGGSWFSPTDLEKAVLYMEGMVRIANETLDDEPREMIRIFARYLVSNTEWLKSIGVEQGGIESMKPALAASLGAEFRFVDGRVFDLGARLILPANLHENTIGCCLIIDNW